MPFLLTAHGRLLELAPGTFVLGRGADCDLVLSDAACSRQHARLSIPAAGPATVEDLGSRNGTHLNARRLRRVETLRGGDRLRTGTTIFVFLERRPATERESVGAAEVETLFLGAERSVVGGDGSEAEFSGRLSALGLLELLQLLIRGERTGVLALKFPDGEAEVTLLDGRLADARFSGVRGIPALFAVALKREGVFWLRPLTGEPASTITLPTPRVLMELCRVMDESERGDCG